MSAPDVMVHEIRVGVFSSLKPADRAVARLLDAGFHPEQITVVCSGEVQENYFQRLRTMQTHPEGEATQGAALGAAIGGLSAITLGAATGAVPLIVAGVAGMAGGGAVGGFIGIMTSREVKNDFLNACHEQVLAGKILVAVEEHGEHPLVRLAVSEQIFNEEGSEMNTLFQP